MESDNYVITKKGLFVGKGYACDWMIKSNVENNKTSTSSVYMLFSINFWHAHLCHINSRYMGIISSLGLIPRLSKDFEKCETSDLYLLWLNHINHILCISWTIW